MMTLLRPARPADAAAIAEVWHSGWRDAHLGNVPDALVALRTAEAFATMAAQRVAPHHTAPSDTAPSDTTTRDETRRHETTHHGRPPGEEASSTTVADIDGIVAGFVMVVGDELDQIFVAAGHRGSGIAGLLLNEAERLIAGGGHDIAWLAVVPGNARARRFYERHGWHDNGPFIRKAAGVDVPCLRYGKKVAGE